MPEVYFTVELPDGAKRECYSPSSVITKYLKQGQQLPVAEFRERSLKALGEASERVRAKFGFYCTAASAQAEDISLFTSYYPDDAVVRILNI